MLERRRGVGVILNQKDVHGAGVPIRGVRGSRRRAGASGEGG
jgi:hypothetical protein